MACYVAKVNGYKRELWIMGREGKRDSRIGKYSLVAGGAKGPLKSHTH